MTGVMKCLPDGNNIRGHIIPAWCGGADEQKGSIQKGKGTAAEVLAYPFFVFCFACRGVLCRGLFDQFSDV